MEDRLKKITQNEEMIKELQKDINIIYQDYYGFDDDDLQDEDAYKKMVDEPEYKASLLESKKKNLLLANRKLRAEIEQEEFDKNFEILSKTFKPGLVTSDNESSVDTLSREMYAKILVRHIVRKEVETPINIGIFGDWGEGKSSFLRLMVNEIDNLNNKNYEHTCHTHVVRYDASEYDEKNKIWASILSTLFEEFEKKNKILGKIKYAFNSFKSSFKSNIIKYLINIIILLLTVVWYLNLRDMDNPLNDIKDSFLTTVGIVPLILFVTNILIPFIKEQLAFIQPLSGRVLSFIETPDYKQELGARENIKSTLNKLLNVWIKGKNERVVLFIDELDRCSDKTISEFFDALQLLFSVKGITVVLSVNYKTVCYSLANNNKYYFNGEISNENKIEFGVDYLRKYINIPVHLPQTRNYEEYITDIIEKVNNEKDASDHNKKIEVERNNSPKENGSKVFENKEDSLIKNILGWVNQHNHLTPREVKNILNILVIIKEIIIIRNKKLVKENNIDSLRFIRWFFFHYFNPKTANKLIFTLEKKDNKEYFNNVKESLVELKQEDIYNVNEKMANNMITLLNDIRVEEIILFKEVSNWFINHYESVNWE